MSPLVMNPPTGGLEDWADLCPHVIVWQSLVSRDNYGKPTWGPVQTYQGRRTYKVQRVSAYERGTKGQGPEVLSSSQIIILATLSIAYEDAVYVQGDAPPYPVILSIGTTPDENGDFYTKVIFGSSNG